MTALTVLRWSVLAASRYICLLEAHPEKLFTHVLYPDWRERLNKLNTISSQEKITED